MWDAVFIQILNMSFLGSFVILGILFVRLFLKKAPKIFSYTLWSVALFRLICPFSFESGLSLLPTGSPIPAKIGYAAVPQIQTGIPALNHTINALLPAATPDTSMNPMQWWIFLGRCLWLAGVAALLIYSVVSLLKLRRKLKGAAAEQGNIYIGKGLATAFVLGLFRPKIYLPAGLEDAEKQYILLHEQTHIKRLDQVVKLVSFFVVCLHWFNPLVWVAFFLSGRDMEMSCDERVIKSLGQAVKKDYSSSLLTLATGRRRIGGSPLAFGEGDTKGRIKNVLGYKKPAFWVILISLAVVICVGIGFIANPVVDEGSQQWARRPMLLADGILYLDTGKEVPETIDSADVLGTITSETAASQKPTKNGQCNFHSGLGAQYAAYNDGMAIFLDEKWFFFEKELP